MPEILQEEPTEDRDALNRHGVFLKKRVVQEVNSIAKLSVYAEEHAVSFETSTAIDLVVQGQAVNRSGISTQQMYSEPSMHLLWFIVECKKVYAKEKRWIFFRDLKQRFRKFRRVGASGGQMSAIVSQTIATGNHPICSEGYELALNNRSKQLEANPDPIYGAGNQLSRGYLGFIARRMEEANMIVRFGGARAHHRVVPVIVTNAPLFVADFESEQISLGTGNLEDKLKLQDVDWLILKHPFSVPHPNAERDFRYLLDNNDQPDQQLRESIFVVQADKLRSFFSEEMLEWFMDE